MRVGVREGLCVCVCEKGWVGELRGGVGRQAGRGEVG